ncbi:MAG TPA: GtrA family protein [Stellaceae bacterium]|nr:GtrA family protein [Stellaceae bacterium]
MTWFGVVGITGAVLYGATVAFAVSWLHWPPTFANATGFLLAMASSYFGHRLLTFRSAVPHQQAAPRFIIQAAIGYATSQGITYLVSTYSLHYAIGICAVVLVLPALNFIVFQFWVFADGTPPSHQPGAAEPPL